jgi:thiamine biosynthesis lipoprotein
MRIERARPLLGTHVAIRAEGLSEHDANRAIDAGFDAVTRVHRLMSFHETDSDVSRLNRDAFKSAQAVDPLTYKVLACAQDVARASDGCFDITVAPQLVAFGLLPEPDRQQRPDANATWRDIELLDASRPLWIDLGGIAKGFAVDCAIAVLREHGAVQGAVNAGGDLRVFGPAPERVLLQTPFLDDAVAPLLEIADAAVASSSGHLERRTVGGKNAGPHIDGANREPVPFERFATVVAERCMIADALTKIVLARGENSIDILRLYGASAHLHNPGHGWWHFGEI